MQKLSDSKIKIVHNGGRSVSQPPTSSKGSSLLGLFTFSRGHASAKSRVVALKTPVPETSPRDIPRADLKAVTDWIGMEEKIVHNYTEQKKAKPQGAGSLPKTPSRDIPPASLTAVTHWVALEEKIIHRYIEQKKVRSRVALPIPAVKTSASKILRAGFKSVTNWIGTARKTLRHYTEQKKVRPRVALPIPAAKTSVKQLSPSFETFSTQTGISAPSVVPQFRDRRRGIGKTFPGMKRPLLVLGWLAAGVFVLFYIQASVPDRKAFQRIFQLQAENEKLRKSYAALKSVSENQSEAMDWLNSRLHNVTLELKKAKAERAAFEQSVEKKYSGELMRITLDYEAELAALRNTVEAQNTIVKALKAQSQAFEKIVDQVRMSALSGAAAGFSQESFSTEKISETLGQVTSINARNNFVVLNLGADQGARPGRWVTISRGGIGLAAGRIDRVYPTMSVAIVRNARMFRVIQEGDSVSFS